MRDKQKLDKLRGVHIAFNTPFDRSGDVNPEATRKLARLYQQAGIDGLYVCGSTGEGFALDVDERKRVLDAVVEEVGDEITVIAHIGAVATRHAIELALHAASLHVDGVSAVPRVYYPISEAEIEQHWLSIIESTDLPFIIYNIPGTTGYNLSLELFEKMVAHEKVYGIKNTTMNAYQILQFRRAAGPDFVIFNGPDEQYLAGRLMGADGGIGGSYGVMPELFVKMEGAIRDEDYSRARQIQEAVDDVIPRMYGLASFCGAAKAIIKIRFTDIGTPRPPQSAVPESGMKAAREVADRIVRYIETL